MGFFGPAGLGGIMGLFNIFKGKDPVRQEEQGDRLYESGAYGQARLEYESAAAKRRRETSNDARIPELDRKVVRCKEALAGEHRKHGDNLADAGYFDDAREYYSLALELTQDSELIATLQRAIRAVESRQMDAALAAPQDADVSEPETREHVDHEAEFESEDECAEALFNTLPEELQAIYTNYGANFRSGYIALQQGRFDEAAQQLSRAFEEHPAPDSHVRLELATAYLNLKRYGEALAVLEEFVPQPLTRMTCRMLCEVYWEAGRFDRALALLDSLAQEKKSDPFYCGLHGGTLFRMGEYDRAESLYLNCLEDCGWNTGITLALAETYEAAGDYKKALELFRKVIDDCSVCHAPIDPQTLRTYADLCMKCGIRNEKVLEIYLNLTEKDPDNIAAYYEKISLIYEALGHEKESRRFLQLAKRYGGSSVS
jgi:tetratricopeptide (TPR) repeat protein